MDKKTYSYGARSAAQLNDDLADFWHRAEEDSSLVAELAAQGVDVDYALAQFREDAAPIVISENGSGLEPATATIIVGFFGPIAKDTIEAAWSNVILPWIRRRRGRDAVGRERE